MSTDTRDVMFNARVVQNGRVYYNIPYAGVSEQLQGYRGPRRPSVINPCTHTRSRIASAPVDLKYNDLNRLSGTIPLTVGSRPDTRAALFVGSISPTVAEVTLRQLQAKMAGDIQPLVSVPNMVLELVPTLNLWRDLKQPLVDLVTMAGVKNKAKAGSCAILAQNFGLFPLLGDLSKLMSNTRSIHTEVSAITKRPTKWTGTSASVPVNPGYTPLIYGSGSFGSLRIEKSSCSGVARVSWLARQCRNIIGPKIASQVARRLYGFDAGPSVLWEATPFSFMVDWFFPIGDYLSALNTSAFADSMEYKQVCTCYTAEATAEVKVSWMGVNSFSHTVRQRIFQRKSGFPASTMTLGDFGLPGLRQLTLGAAIAVQRL